MTQAGSALGSLLRHDKGGAARLWDDIQRINEQSHVAIQTALRRSERMKARFDAFSDVAALAAWDAARDATFPASPEQQLVPDAVLDAEAAAGHVFLVRMGGDGGGRVDVYVDEAIPADVRDRLVPAAGEFRLDLPSGRLIVDGAEYYPSSPLAADPQGPAALPAGHYSVRCYTRKDDEQTPRSEDALRQLVGSADLAYYDRVNNKGCRDGALTLLLFPILTFTVGWKIALGVTIVVFVSFFHVRERVLKRNDRYQRLDKVIPAFRRQNEEPLFVFELRSITNPNGLKGGSVSIDVAN